jgi:protein-disulfide isomerase
MAADQKQGTARATAQTSRLADISMVATLVGLVVIMVVSLLNKRELQRLSARVIQLEKLAAAPTPANALLGKIYEVDVAAAPARGAAAAPVTIAEFSEFQCPFCLRARATIAQIQETYKDRVRFVWKHLPLVGIHSHAMGAAVAAEAARNQGRFWEYHDKLFANQERLAPDDLRRYAQELGLDLARFDRDRDDPDLTARVQSDMAQATALGVKSTPTFFINGRLVSGAMPFEIFATIIDDELAKQKVAARSFPFARPPG